MAPGEAVPQRTDWETEGGWENSQNSRRMWGDKDMLESQWGNVLQENIGGWVQQF